MLFRPSIRIPTSEITEEKLYWTRRDFLAPPAAPPASRWWVGYPAVTC